MKWRTIYQHGCSPFRLLLRDIVRTFLDFTGTRFVLYDSPMELFIVPGTRIIVYVWPSKTF
jgi:hypothetical protein